MVEGIDKFRKFFSGYEDCYTVIGGTACDILMSEADLKFRATKDIDIILIIEDRRKEFASVFWEYIKAGNYKCGWKNTDSAHFYRFTEPQPGYPVMIELFSKKQSYHLEFPQGIIPVHVDDSVSSLSAILLNDDFYNFMLEGRKIVNGVSVLKPEYLIPFKMYAWVDLTRRKSCGEHVNERDLKKHRNDVFRLLQIVEADSHIATKGIVLDAINDFLSSVEIDDTMLKQLGVPFLAVESIEILKKMFVDN